MNKGTHYFSNEEMGISLTVNIGELKSGSLLAGKVIMITGATGGMGFAIAQKCVQQGAYVIIADINEERLEKAEKQLGEACRSICFDVLNISEYDAVFEKAEGFFGNIDCLVNNAGISLHEGDFMNVTEKTWDAQMDINLKAPFFLTQAWLRRYRKNNMKQGHIVMMASDTSGMGSSIPYGLSKAGIASFTRGLAKHVITEGIRINAIAPGTTRTPMTDDFTHGEVCRTTTAGKRVLFPEEIAETAVFLLSDLSTCISGQIIGCTESNICFDNTAGEEETNP